MKTVVLAFLLIYFIYFASYWITIVSFDIGFPLLQFSAHFKLEIESYAKGVKFVQAILFNYMLLNVSHDLYTDRLFIVCHFYIYIFFPWFVYTGTCYVVVYLSFHPFHLVIIKQFLLVYIETCSSCYFFFNELILKHCIFVPWNESYLWKFLKCELDLSV